MAFDRRLCRVVRVASVSVLFCVAGFTLPGRAQAPSQERKVDPALERMATAMRIARDRHFSKPEPADMLNGAIQGMLAKLDPDVEVLDRRQAARLDQTVVAADVGVLIRSLPPEPRRGSPGYRIVSARDGSPAAMAGLRAGDVLTHIDDVSASDLGPADVRVLLASTPGFVQLTVDRPGINSPLTLLLERQPIRASVPHTVRVQEGVAVVRIGQLDGAATKAVIDRLRVEAAAASGLIIDLRDSAGPVSAAVDLADALLEQGVIAQLDTRAKEKSRTYTAKPRDVTGGKPIVVVVNGGSADGAEVLAAALQDNKRARVVGTPTAGRAIVREYVALGPARPDTVAALTTGRYLTPNGRRLDQGGVKPDIVLTPQAAAQPCREVDTPASDGAGVCVPRAFGADAALQSALAAFPGKTEAKSQGTAKP